MSFQEFLIQHLPKEVANITNTLKGFNDEKEFAEVLKKNKKPHTKLRDLSSALYQNFSSRFRLQKKSYSQQFSQLYFCRLRQLKPRLIVRVNVCWKDKMENECALLSENIKDTTSNQLCVIIGVLYKDMKLKPSALDQYLKELEIQTTALESYLSDEDKLYLEDEDVRIPLIFAAENHFLLSKFVTGLVIACLGYRRNNGDFQVQDWCFPGVMIPRAVPKLDTKQAGLTDGTEKQYIGFISGITLGSPKLNYDSLLRLRDFLLGALTQTKTAQESQQIVRLVVLGEIICVDDPQAPEEKSVPIRDLTSLDNFLSLLACSLPVDLVPGSRDPTNYLFPQQPLNPILFPQSSLLSTFQSVTNPYSFSLGQTSYLVTTEEPITDILNFSSIETPIEALQMVTEAQCLCPTAPDTLPCYPFVDSDPFVWDAETCPHLIVSGNHDRFQVKYWDGASNKWVPSLRDSANLAIMCIPRFTVEPVLVIVGLDTLDIKIINF